MITSFRWALNSIRDWHEYSKLMARLRYKRKRGDYIRYTCV